MPQVQVTEHGVVLLVSAAETSAWGARWPLSRLRGHRLRAVFDRTGSLVDYVIDGRGSPDVPSDEFNALTSDMLRGRLSPTHPAYFGCVGQFDRRR